MKAVGNKLSELSGGASGGSRRDSGVVAPHKRRRRTQDERSATTRRQILDAAADCLAELGYAASTLGAISARAAVSRGALQHHFGTREELLMALVNDLGEKLIAPYESDRGQKLSLAKRVELVIDEDWAKLSSPLFIAVMQVWLAMRGSEDLFTHVSDKVGEVERHLDALWAQLFADTGIGPTRIRALRHLVFSTLRGLAIRALSRKENISSDQEIGLMKELVKRALA